MESKINFRPSFAKKWLVIYVRPRWEKKVDKLLQEQGIESFCPVRNVESQWADRKKMVSFPLFAGYVFVKINEREEYRVRATMGVLNFIYYLGRPAVVRDNEIEKLKYIADSYHDAEVVSLDELSKGDKVRIKSGLFHDQEGRIIQIQGKHVLMSFDNLDCAVVTRVSVNNLMLTVNQQQQYV
ncbi:UpxY family transcription antiterminator [Pedobacter rhizosphaerae]|jgi:transcription antitermination factor NusG|uniref:Transcription antitermination factor NusG n=1 Tax=Pedobacter rhizosphaerae TaxID=390241 RepID=A0A1H9M3M8_9SPHI|nr:UpxY family transcription antiterminator [Pedobacter rhizosphaerae]SER18254.1 Transcription antitermination factor NusG [Pedobacter rhizosphaerae]